ncbi:MAG: esterase-like activity of phytase family protein [Rhodospirillales bacterium]|nr:esterase-like activity of phytase family protein [Rhodospirillales bacterium]
MRWPLPILFCLLLLLPAPGARAGEALEVSARAVALDPADPARRAVGGLIWRGGLELSSPDRRFGGFSGLLVSADGTRLTAATDRGQLMTARLVYDAAGDLAGLDEAALEALTGLDGKPLEGKQNQDAESLALAPDGPLLVSFEHEHRIWRYPLGPAGLAGPPAAFAPAPPIAGLPRNKGLEALASLADGRLVGVTQGRDAEPDIAVLLLQDGGWSELRYPKTGIFTPTGASPLPGGGLLVLERRFTLLGGPAARLVRVEGAAIRPGAALAGREVAVLRPPLAVDNMEGLAARRGPGGETLVYLISDDNFHILQRTLLLMFELAQ